MRFNIVSIVAFVASTMALTVTNPRQNAQVDLSKPLDIKWRSVEGDADTVTLELVNMAGNHVNKKLADVKTSVGHYKVDKVWDIPTSEGYQINVLANNSRNTGILAQSQQFNVTKVADPPKTSTASHASATTEAAPEPTHSTGGSAALAIPAAGGSLLMGLFALMV
ncbi:hypothetical protein FE257_007294 [Aspergillus nanangensis]|uniref:Yeast cell wall synthesis Kre9/Knh1-like N-terminal domain-containing protein n=1 Tax=Aspergillus nanangensis TaxID=2582783 RepID=A0AAD4GVE7_ASPNN|nr:hypothetical protein FE257_007294 [Aspergillus nanangensis]